MIRICQNLVLVDKLWLGNGRDERVGIIFIDCKCQRDVYIDAGAFPPRSYNLS